MTLDSSDRPPHTLPLRSHSRSTAPIALLLIVLTFAAYAPTIAFEFTNWDDQMNVYNNPHLQPVTTQTFRFFWTEPYGRLYAPIAYSSLAADALIWGIEPAGFHATNTALHAVCVGLVFLLLLRMFDGDKGAAVVGALLFALHPLQVEAVTWVTGRKDLLAGILSVSSILMYLRWRRRGGMVACAAAILLFCLAVLSKPSAVSVPIMLFCADVLFFGRTPRRSLTALAPWFLIVAGVILMTHWAQPPAEIEDQPPALWRRTFVACDALLFYLGKVFYPTGLVALYDRTPNSVLASTWAYLAPLPVLAISLAVWRAAPALRCAAAWTFAGLLPVLGLHPFEYQGYSTVADRYFYLSALGMALAAGWLYARARNALSGKRSRLSIRLAATLVLFAAAAGALTQQRTWKNARTLWTHNLKYYPDCPLANFHIGAMFSKRGEPANAVPYYRRAIAARNDFARAKINLANDLMTLGDLQARQGLSQQARALYDQAIESYEAILLTEPRDSRVYFNAALAYQTIGDNASAERLYRDALQHEPELADAHANLGSIHLRRRHFSQAMAHFRAALRIDPNHPVATQNLWRALNEQD